MRGSRNPQSWIRLYDAADSSIPASQAVVHIAAARNEVLSDLDFEYIAPTAKAVIGETYVYASVYAYGETFLDSTLFRRIDPPIRLIVVDRIFPANGEATVEFMPGMITAKAGTTVIFFNRFGYSEQHPSDFFDICLADYCGNQVRRSREYPQSTLVWVDSIDVVFENPAQVGAAATVGYMDFPGVWGGEFISDGGTGNIPPFGLMYCKTTGTGGDCGGRITPQTFSVNVVVETGVRGRKFTVPGTYHYTSTRFPNARGTIIITE